jgi:hypothetical protein
MVAPVPRFALDFTTESLDPRVTITRALNTGTRFNSSGSLQVINANLPRFDYTQKTGGACKGLLIEETRINFLNTVNLVNPSNTTGWSKTGDAAATFSVVSDSTELTAAKLDSVCTSGNVYKLDNSAGTTSAFAIITSAVNFGTANVALSAYARGSGSCRLEVNVGTWTGNTNLSLSSAYNRISVVGSTNTSSNQFRVRAFAGAVVYFVLVQAEVGNFPTSVILNTGSAVTRNADVVTITGTNFSGFWNAGVGGTTVTALPSTVSGTRPLVQFDDGTANEIIVLRGNTTNPELYIVDGGTPQAQIDAGTIAANTAYSLTGWWQTNFCAARKDNDARVEDLTATIPTVTQARIGSDGTNYLNGTIATISYYDKFSGQIYTRRKNKCVFTVL